ncbi:MAG TPA: hypothetical protein VH496_08575 [Mycobacterium sp.]
MSRKTLAAGIAAAALVGVAAAGVTSIAPAATAYADVDASLTPEFTDILNQLANTGTVSDKSYLIDGGLGFVTGKEADRQLKKAAAKGYLPLSFNLTPPDVNGNTATTTVTASGPNLEPVTQPLTFVNNDGWKLSRTSAMAIMATASG